MAPRTKPSSSKSCVGAYQEQFRKAEEDSDDIPPPNFCTDVSSIPGEGVFATVLFSGQEKEFSPPPGCSSSSRGERVPLCVTTRDGVEPLTLPLRLPKEGKRSKMAFAVLVAVRSVADSFGLWVL